MASSLESVIFLQCFLEQTFSYRTKKCFLETNDFYNYQNIILHPTLASEEMDLEKLSDYFKTKSGIRITSYIF